MTRSRLLAATLTVAAATAAAVGVGALPATAASCRVMIVENDPPVGLALSPKTVDVSYGGCVQFSDNAVGPAVTITVSGGYTVTLNYGESTDSKNSYNATSTGTHAVTASNGAASARGSITVGASPTPSPRPSPSSSHSHSSTPPHQHQQPSRSASPPPRVAPTPAASKAPATPPVVPSLRPLPTAQATTPAPGMSPSLPPAASPTPTSSPVAVIAGPLQPPTNRGFGLPAALAALALVGVATALLRVLLAHAPVDTRRTVGGSA